MQFLDKAGVSILVNWVKQNYVDKSTVIVPAEAPTASWGNSVSIGSVDGKSFQFVMPSNPVSSSTVTGSGTSGQMAVWTGTNTIGSQAIPTVNNAKFAVNVGNTEVASTTANASTASSVTFAAGSNVTITPNATDKTITIASTDTDTKVTSVDNHYTPSANAGSALSVDASGATAAWGIDVVTGVNIQRDAKGHVTGVTVDSGKIPANPVSANTVTTTSTLGANTVVLGNGNKTVKNSSYTLGGATLASSPSSTVLATEAAVADAVSGLSGAMHFVGTTSGTMTDGQTTNPTVSGVSSFSAGDVVVDSTETEFVLGNEATPKWHKLGDANSYALSNNVVNSWKGAGDDWITVSPTTATKGAVSATFSHGGSGAAFSAKGSATKVPQITTDSKGHVTNITEVTITQPSVGNAALTIAADSGTGTQAFTANSSTASSITFAGGDNIATAVSGSANAPTVTINHDVAGTGSAITTSQGTASAASAGTSYDVVTGVTVSADSYGHITGVSTTRQKVVSNSGTVTSITPGTGLTGASSDTAITTSGTINLKKAAIDEIGGIIVSAVGSSAATLTNTTSGVTARAVVTDSAGKAYVNVPNYATSSGVTSITPGAGLVNGSNNKNAITSTGTVKAALVSETALSAAATTTVTETSSLHAVMLDSNGKLAVKMDEAIPESELQAILYPSS